jgi:hypothetical protein
MGNRIRSRLTYANVTASVALFAALGGGAYAAATLPRHSVGTKQLKNSSVGTKQLKRHAVTGSKLDPRVIALFKGQTGNAGATGAAGPRGPSDAYLARKDSSQANQSFVSVTVPPGDYAADGGATARNNTGGTLTGACTLNSTVSDPNDDIATGTVPDANALPFSNSTAFHMPNGGAITEDCYTSAATGLEWLFTHLRAIQVATLHP